MTDRFARCEGRPYLDGVWGPPREASCWGSRGAQATDASLITPTKAMLGWQDIFFSLGGGSAVRVFNENLPPRDPACPDMTPQYSSHRKYYCSVFALHLYDEPATPRSRDIINVSRDSS